MAGALRRRAIRPRRRGGDRPGIPEPAISSFSRSRILASTPAGGRSILPIARTPPLVENAKRFQQQGAPIAGRRQMHHQDGFKGPVAKRQKASIRADQTWSWREVLPLKLTQHLQRQIKTQVVVAGDAELRANRSSTASDFQQSCRRVDARMLVQRVTYRDWHVARQRAELFKPAGDVVERDHAGRPATEKSPSFFSGASSPSVRSSASRRCWRS